MDTLPNELLLEIINQVLLEESHGLFNIDLVNISLVNRRLNRLAKQRIYGNYKSARGNPALFIRTLASWPIKARCVQVVDWDCRLAKDYPLVTDDTFLLPDDLTPTEFRKIKREIGLDENLDTGSDSDENLNIADMNNTLSRIGTDAYLCLLLSLTPRVHTLRVAIPSVWSFHSVWFNSVLRLPTLSNLSKATIIGPMRIAHIVPLFLLPSLRNLTLDHVAHDRNRILRHGVFEWHEYHKVVEQLHKKGSGIKNFQVQNCSIDTMRLARLLRFFHHLETLEFEFTGSEWDKTESEVGALLDSLSHSSSLTSLSIKDFRLTIDRNTVRRMSSLKNITFLLLDITILCVHPSTVESLSWLFKQLPTGLQHLQLIANDHTGEELAPSFAFCEALFVLAPTVKTILPALHTLEVVDWDPFLGTFTCQTKVKAIQLAFAGTGVRFLSRPLTLPPEYEGSDIVTLDREEQEELEEAEGEEEEKKEKGEGEEDWLWTYWVDRFGNLNTYRDSFNDFGHTDHFVDFDHLDPFDPFDEQV